MILPVLQIAHKTTVEESIQPQWAVFSRKVSTQPSYWKRFLNHREQDDARSQRTSFKIYNCFTSSTKRNILSAQRYRPSIVQGTVLQQIWYFKGQVLYRIECKERLQFSGNNHGASSSFSKEDGKLACKSSLKYWQAFKIFFCFTLQYIVLLFSSFFKC